MMMAVVVLFLQLLLYLAALPRLLRPFRPLVVPVHEQPLLVGIDLCVAVVFWRLGLA